jgi:uncharacterized membrane protein YebE (DUF533 family)
LETLGLLITMAWADGRLDESEKAGVRGAAAVFNLSQELRDKLDLVLAKPTPVEYLLFDTLSPKDRAFAYVAAAWMSGVDEDVDEREEQLLDKLGEILGFSTEKKAELERIARDLPAAGKDGRNWSEEISALFKAIPPRLEEDDDVEVVFE